MPWTNRSRLPLALCWLGLASTLVAAQSPASQTPAPSQTASQPATKPAETKPSEAKPTGLRPAPAAKFLLLLDPAHGGTDPGVAVYPNTAIGGTPAESTELQQPHRQLSDPSSSEKDLTLALAGQLQSLLTSQGAEVRLTRTTDATLTAAQRAQLANQLTPVASVTLHATSVGTGVHVFYPLNGFGLENRTAFDAWSSTEAPPNHRSLDLARRLAAALHAADLSVTLEPAADPVLSRERCPAVAIELGPQQPNTSASNANAAPPSAPLYQQRVLQALAQALLQWRTDQRALDASASSYAHQATASSRPANGAGKAVPKP